MRRKDVDGKEVSEAMVRSGQVVEDGVVDGSQVSSKQVDEEFIPGHDESL
jgi:hypothetical protein